MRGINSILMIFLLGCLGFNASSANGDFETVKKRVIETMMRHVPDDAEINVLLDKLQSNGTWPGIDYTDVSNTGFQHTRHLGNMVDLAEAYNSVSSDYFRNERVRNAIIKALGHWVEHDYICENWWHNQIGTPDALVELMLLAGDELPKELVEKTQPIIMRANVDAPGARPGGDRIKIAGIEAKNALFRNDSNRLKELVKIIEKEIKHVSWIGTEYGYGYRPFDGGFENRSAQGRGIQADNSFHHRVDGVNNTLSYGMGYASAFVEWLEYTAGTGYAFSEEKLHRLTDYYLDGICKHLVFGKYPDAGAKNRSISRKGALDAVDDGIPEVLMAATDHRKAELQEIVSMRTKDIHPSKKHAAFFWNSEHFTFQRPHYFTSVRLYSSRNYNMEVPYNSEGLLNHHRGDGVNHVYTAGNEYYNIWPVYDYQKIPGTTVLQKPQLPRPDDVQKLGRMDFAGAVSNGTYGAVGFDFKSPHDPLVCRKSWFFFDEEYVCLGTGISCRSDLPVVTTVNQCLLQGNVTVSDNNGIAKAEKGEKALNQVNWIHHDGIGYIFQEPATVHLKNDAVPGSWWRITKQSDTSRDEVKLDVFKLWIDHGTSPSNESYQYIVVPGVTPREMENRYSNKNVEVLSNTPELQAVKHAGQQIFQAVFYAGGEVLLDENLKLVCDNPGMIMIRMKDGKVSEITLSDPNRELKRFHFSLNARIYAEGDNFKTSWNADEHATFFTVDLPGGDYAGESVILSL